MPSLYVHVPFCLQKCDYCAFYSHSLKDSSPELIISYLEGLEIELAKRQKDAPQGVSSLFIGGGTPSVLEAKDLERLLGMVRKFFPSDQQTERTMEGNPGTLTEEKIDIIQRQGINRFSLGIQSFNDKLLKLVGRIHTADQARKAIQELRSAGFKNLNLDLMFGLPGQTLEVWQETLEEALENSPEHLSLYGLMLEEGTPLYKRYSMAGNPYLNVQSALLPDENLQAEMYEWAVRRLKRAGYRHYETSNFARRGYECRHNLGYWRGEDYLGVGPGGVTYLKRVRWKNIEDVCMYRQRLVEHKALVDEAGEEVLTLRECMAERIILGLRLEEGVDLQAFRKDFGADLRDIYQRVLERYTYKDVFRIEGGFLRLNAKYSFVANSILQEFV